MKELLKESQEVWKKSPWLKSILRPQTFIWRPNASAKALKRKCQPHQPHILFAGRCYVTMSLCNDGLCDSLPKLPAVFIDTQLDSIASYNV